MKNDILGVFRKAKNVLDDIKRKTEVVYENNEGAIKSTIDTAQKKAAEATEAVKKTTKDGIDLVRNTYRENEDTIEKTVDGIRSSAEDVANDVKGTVIPQPAIDARAHAVHVQSLLWQSRTSEWRNRSSQSKDTLIDCLIVGGIPLAGILSGTESVSDEIVTAFELAYPNVAASTDFIQHVQDMDVDALTGFVSGIKGKLFEIRYVEHLNSGILEDGYSASLAESATNSGWDLAISGPDGELAQVIQAKATDSVAYVQAAFEQYPYIDVVTTEEVYNDLMAEGLTSGLIDSGIANDALTDAVMDATGAGNVVDSSDFVPPIIGLALIAYTAYKKADLDAYQKAKNVGDRTGKASLSLLAGYGLASVTGLVLLAPLASVVTRGVLSMGQRKARAYEGLNARYENYKRANARLARSLNRIAST